MKKTLIILFLLFLGLEVNGCGSSGSSSSPSNVSGTTRVAINIGQAKSADRPAGLFKTTDIPYNVTTVRITISAPDMETIVRIIDLAGANSISETFDVPNGFNRHFVVEGITAGGDVIYRGDVYADLNGSPVYFTIPMVSTDFSPPPFGGISTIESVTTTSMLLTWQPATDNATSPDRIQYLIYVSPNQPRTNFDNPDYVTPPGATSYLLTDLIPNTEYFVIIKAKDEAGNVDSNTFAMSARTKSGTDIVAPGFTGVGSALPASSTSVTLSWNPASDNQTPPQDMVYLIYISTVSGQQNFQRPSFTTAPGATTFTVTGLTGSSYYFVVRAQDASGNVDNNFSEISVNLLPPAFAGVVPSFCSASATSVTLAWNPATDAVTAAQDIVYLVYMSSTPGGQDFTTPTFITAPGARSYTVTGIDAVNTSYYFVVRAKNSAGLTDANTVEYFNCTYNWYPKSVTMTGGVMTGVSNMSFMVCGTGTCGVTSLPVYVEYSDMYWTDCAPVTVTGLAGTAGAAPLCLEVSVSLFNPINYRVIVDPGNKWLETNENDNCVSNDPASCQQPAPQYCPFPAYKGGM